LDSGMPPLPEVAPGMAPGMAPGVSTGDAESVASVPPRAGSQAAGSRPQPAAASVDPVLASMAPFVGQGAGTLVLRFNAESWVDVVGSDGTRIERGLVGAGSERRYDAG